MTPVHESAATMKTHLDIVKHRIEDQRLIGAFFDCEHYTRDKKEYIVEVALVLADDIAPADTSSVKYNKTVHGYVWHIKQPELKKDTSGSTIGFTFHHITRIACPHATTIFLGLESFYEKER